MVILHYNTIYSKNTATFLAIFNPFELAKYLIWRRFSNYRVVKHVEFANFLMERNTRIKEAMKNMKNDLQLLDDFNKEQVPDDFGTGGGDDAEDEAVGQQLQHLSLMPAQMTLPMPPGFFRPADAGNLLVGTQAIGPNVQLTQLPGEEEEQRRFRGPDKSKRHERRCAQCYHRGESLETQKSCPGQQNQKRCPMYCGEKKSIPRRKR